MESRIYISRKPILFLLLMKLILQFQRITKLSLWSKSWFQIDWFKNSQRKILEKDNSTTIAFNLLIIRKLQKNYPFQYAIASSLFEYKFAYVVFAICAWCKSQANSILISIDSTMRYTRNDQPQGLKEKKRKNYSNRSSLP